MTENTKYSESDYDIQQWEESLGENTTPGGYTTVVIMRPRIFKVLIYDADYNIYILWSGHCPEIRTIEFHGTSVWVSVYLKPRSILNCVTKSVAGNLIDNTTNIGVE